MHFVKALVSFVAVAMPMGALAAPSASTEAVANKNINLDDLLDNYPPSKRELAIRQGNTCAFGGDQLCTTRCFVGGNGGGFCNDRNVCECNG